MRRPRTVNGYSIKDILDDYRYRDIGDGPFWEAAYKFFGQSQMADMRSLNMEHHADMIWEAKAHCEEHGGFWGQEDEEEEMMAAMFDLAGRRAPRMAALFFYPLSDEEYDRQNNPKHNRYGRGDLGFSDYNSDYEVPENRWPDQSD